MRIIRNPVVQFLATGVLVLMVVVAGMAQLSRRAAEQEAISDARSLTRLLATSVAEPALPHGLVSGDPTAVEGFDRTTLDRLLVGDVQRIKIWRADGRVVYSDDHRLIGSSHPLGGEEREVLRNGGSDAELSDLAGRENRYERGLGGLLEVYTRISSPEGEPLLFEVYYSAADVADRQQQVYDAFQPIALGGLVVLVGVTTPLLWVLTRRLERTARDRQRLLETAADASEAERRRIARDLHEGVVQELAVTSSALAATVGDPATDPRTARRLEPLAGSLRTSLRSLRSLLVDIYPPDLTVDGLAAALDDLVAPAAAAGVTAAVEVYDVRGASDESLRLVWRVAKEAVRNTVRHARADELAVQVRSVGDRLVLDVTDDGAGFRAGEKSGALGLRALRDLIREAGGTLEVRSSDGRGTTVHLEVAR